MTISFGIIVACSTKDWPLALGAVDSIRTHMSEVPICLLVDGEVSRRQLGRLKNVEILCRKDVEDKRLRNESFSWGITKMVAFWESPFERFIMMDADTCVMGDLSFLQDAQEDLILDGSTDVRFLPEEINRYWLNPVEIEKMDPSFRWREYPYVNVGVYLGKQQLFPVESYLSLLRLHRKNPDLFRCADQGILNFMAFQGQERGEVSLGFRSLQVMVPNFSTEELEQRFGKESAGEPVVLHWCGPIKPWLYERERIFTAPMTRHRHQFLQRAFGIRSAGIRERILLNQERCTGFRRLENILILSAYALRNRIVGRNI